MPPYPPSFQKHAESHWLVLASELGGEGKLSEADPSQGEGFDTENCIECLVKARYSFRQAFECRIPSYAYNARLLLFACSGASSDSASLPLR